MNVSFNPMISNNAQWSNAQKINHKGSNILNKHADKCFDKYGEDFGYMLWAKGIICSCILAIVAIRHYSERSHAELAAYHLEKKDPTEFVNIQSSSVPKPVKDLMYIRTVEHPNDTTFMEKLLCSGKQTSEK